MKKIDSKSCLRIIACALAISSLNNCFARDHEDLKNVETVFIRLGDEAFSIPREYMSPSADYPSEIKLDYNISVFLYLPDFRGFESRDRLPLVGVYDPNQVHAYWTRMGSGDHLDAAPRLANSVKFGLLERDQNLDFAQFEAYRNTNTVDITY